MSNFSFLEQENPSVFALAREAEERYRKADVIGCVSVLRALGERVVAQLMRAHRMQDIWDSQAQRIEDLHGRGKIHDTSYHALHVIRDIGNEAVHSWSVSQADALKCLERAYMVCVLERGVLAPQCKFTVQQYQAPEFGEADTDLDSLRSENAELKAQLEEVTRLIEGSMEEAGEAGRAEAAEETGIEALGRSVSREDLVRLWRIAQLRDLKTRYTLARRQGRGSPDGLAGPLDARSEQPSRLWYEIKRLTDEVEQSFVAERDFAMLLARKHKAALIRRKLEAEGLTWPATWDDELARVEGQIASLAIDRWRFDRDEAARSEEAICQQILEGMRRQAIAAALRRAYHDNGLEWRPELSEAQRALDSSVIRLWAMEVHSASGPESIEAELASPIQPAAAPMAVGRRARGADHAGSTTT